MVCAFSNRALDLGFEAGSKKIKNNRKKFLQALKINYKDLVCMRQVHRAKIMQIRVKDKGKGALGRIDAIANCDAMITREKNIPVAALTADCLPVFLYDKEKSAIAIVHAGWRGTYRNIAQKAVNLMRNKFKSKPKDVIVAFGPAIRSCCYEVGKEFKRYFPNKIIKRSDKFFLDLVDVNKKSLIELGVKINNIIDSKICTSCSNQDFFSYRKEGSSVGRMMSVAMLR